MKTASLGKAISSFCAEVAAIKLALGWAEELTRNLYGSHPTTVTIISDCQQAITHAKKSHTETTGAYWHQAKVISNVKAILRARQHTVRFCWIPGHTGLANNDLADSKAREAALTSLSLHSAHDLVCQVERPFLLARSFVKRRLENWKLLKWTHSNKGRHLYQFQSNPSQGQPGHHMTLQRRTQVALSRLRIGNATTNLILWKMGKVSSANCDKCNTEIDSPGHRILRCPAYLAYRNKLVGRIPAGSSLSLETLLSPSGPTAVKTATTSAFVAFLESSKLLDLFIWRSP